MSVLTLPDIGVEPQQAVLHELLGELETHPSVDGILLDGSFARGDYRNDSDLDLYVLLRRSATPVGWGDRFRRDRVSVDFHEHDVDVLRERLAQTPMRIYRHLYGQILLDRSGDFAEIALLARRLLEDYRTPEDLRARLVLLLETVIPKLRANVQAADSVVTGWAAAWGSEGLASALFAANDQPLPPASVVLRYLRLLPNPDNIEQRLTMWFTAPRPADRAKAMLELTEWCLDALAVSR